MLPYNRSATARKFIAFIPSRVIPKKCADKNGRAGLRLALIEKTDENEKNRLLKQEWKRSTFLHYAGYMIRRA